MTQDPVSITKLELSRAILTDDLPDWVDWEESDDSDGDSEGNDSTDRPLDSPINTETPPIGEHEGAEPQTQQGPQLTITICHGECHQCGSSTTRRHHEGCTAPIIYIGDVWRCAECGIRSSPQPTCFECGAQVDRTRIEVPLDLQLSANSTAIERAIHEETNNRRATHNLTTLDYSHHLSAIALQHSRDMAQREFFSHNSPEGNEALDRYRKFDHNDRSCGENIAMIYPDCTASSREAAQSVVDDWMDSPGHRENILRDQFDMEGIGVYLDPSGAMYATQNFY